MTLTLLLWGFMNVPTVFALKEMPPLQLLVSRTAIATAILAPLAWSLEGRLLPERGDRLTAALMGLSGVAGNNTCYFYAIKYTSLTNVAILYATSPLITALLARVFLGEKLTPRRVLGIALAFGGAVTLLCRGDLSLLTSFSLNRGDQIELGAAFCSSVMTILGRKIRRTPPITVTLCNMFTGFVAAAVLILAVGEPVNLSLSPRAFWGMLYIGIFASGFAYLCQQISIQRIGAGATSAFLNASPALSIIGATAFLGESIAIIQVVSAAVIFAGIFLNAGHAHKTAL